MPWGFVIAAAISAAGAYAQSSQQQKGQKKAFAARKGVLDGLTRKQQEAIFGTKVDLPDYIPVDLTQSQLDTVRGNLKTFEPAKQLAEKVTDANVQIDLDRARSILPNYDEIVGSIGRNAEALAGGQLPYDDVLDIVSNRGQLSGRLGLSGSGMATNATLRDLGISRLDAMNQGQNMFQSFMSTAAQAISPLSRAGDVRESFLTPAQRAQFDIQQRIHQYQADALQAQAEAMPDPAASQLFMAEYENAGGKAALDYNAWIGPALSTIGSAVGSGYTNYNAQKQEQARTDAYVSAMNSMGSAYAPPPQTTSYTPQVRTSPSYDRSSPTSAYNWAPYANYA